MPSIRTTWISLTLFAIAMGLLESIVVIYLRELYYPEGFAFPLKAMKPGLVSTELFRELATLVMLVTIGILVGKNKTTRFAWFIYAFAIWDLFYYIFLKLLIHWPDSLFTWDILFLIPVTWVGPVLGPVINSLVMILLALQLIRGNMSKAFHLRTFEWFLLIVGSIIIILSYTKEYSAFMLTKFSLMELLSSSNQRQIIAYTTSFVPADFDWCLYSSGVLVHLLVIVSLHLRRTSIMK
jgi:hypothetical protein